LPIAFSADPGLSAVHGPNQPGFRPAFVALRGLAGVTPPATRQFELTQASEQTRKVLRQNLGRDVVACRAQDGSKLREQIKITMPALGFGFAHHCGWPFADNARGVAIVPHAPCTFSQAQLGSALLADAGHRSCIGSSARRSRQHALAALIAYPQARAAARERQARRSGFSHDRLCRVSTERANMKVLHLAAVVATFAVIFGALMLCGAALIATLHKAIASAPATVILS